MEQQRIFLEDEPEKTLIYAIFVQAVNDYRKLQIGHKSPNKCGKGLCTNKEIEGFFNGNWCQELLDGLSIKITGKEILYKLQNESIDFTKMCVNRPKFI